MIRKANPIDATNSIDLIDLALEDISFTLTGTNDKAEARAVLRDFFIQKDNIYSFENVFVYEVNGKVVGAMCAYESNLRDELLKPIVARLCSINKNSKIDKECFDDEYYIDTIGVDISFRRQGIATKLIHHAFLQSKNLGIKNCSLVVDILKPQTKKFYESLGFCENCVIKISDHKYFHMLKEIK